MAHDGQRTARYNDGRAMLASRQITIQNRTECMRMQGHSRRNNITQPGRHAAAAVAITRIYPKTLISLYALLLIG